MICEYDASIILTLHDPRDFLEILSAILNDVIR